MPKENVNVQVLQETLVEASCILAVWAAAEEQFNPLAMAECKEKRDAFLAMEYFATGKSPRDNTYSEAPTLSEEHIEQRVAQALASYRCQHTCDADGDAADLVDVLTPPEATNIAEGIREVELLAEHITMTIVDDAWAGGNGKDTP